MWGSNKKFIITQHLVPLLLLLVFLAFLFVMTYGRVLLGFGCFGLFFRRRQEFFHPISPGKVVCCWLVGFRIGGILPVLFLFASSPRSRREGLVVTLILLVLLIETAIETAVETAVVTAAETVVMLGLLFLVVPHFELPLLLLLRQVHGLYHFCHFPLLLAPSGGRGGLLNRFFVIHQLFQRLADLFQPGCSLLLL